MALAIATNNAALKAAIAADRSNKDMETSMARLSSGNRINSASDDAAGVAIASRLTADIRGTDQAIRNALDGQALLDTAEGAHKEIENILQRMREVSVQAGNDTNNQQDRDNLQAELNALSTEIDRIAGTTTWAGTGLLNGDGTGGAGTASDFSFQVGANTSEADRISVQIGAMSTEALGFDSTAAVAAVPQIGGEAQPVTIASGTNSTASGSLFSLDNNTVTSGGDPQAVTIAAGTQTTAAGSIITLDAGTTTISTDTVTHVATTTAVTGATATDPETTVTTTTTKVHTRTGGTAADPTIAGGNQITTTGNVISLDLNTPTEFTPTKAGAEFQVNTHTNGEQRAPVVANLVNGGFVVAWGDQSNADGDGNGVFGQMYDAFGNTVGSEFQINTHINSNQRYPSISGLSDGGFVVTWHSISQDGDDDGVFGQRYDASGNASGPEFQINTHTTSYQQFSSVTSLNDGGFVVTWHSDQDGGWGVYGQRFDSSGNASGAEFKINSTSTNYLLYPSVSGFSDGGFIATWYGHGDKDTNGDGVYGQRYDQYGNTIGSEFLINTEKSGNQIQPAVTALSNGGFVATWTSAGQDANGEGVYAQRYNASGEKDGSEFRVNTDQNGDERYSEVTSLTDGGYVVTWYSNTHTDDTNYGVHGQRFDASGAAVGSQFLVNSTTTNAQIYPMIAALADSGFVVTWQSYLQDGSNYGIFAQRFEAAYETPLASNASVVVNGKTLTVDLSSHHNGSVNDHYGAAAAIASAINNDSDLQTAGYHATVATVDQVNAGTHAAGDVIITRAHIPDETITTDTTSATTTIGAALSMTPTKLGEEFQVNTFTSGTQNGTAVTSLNDGGCLITWTSNGQDASGYFNIYGQRYDKWGNTVGSEFQINTYTSGHQWSPSTASLANGDVVVTWSSEGGSGGGMGGGNQEEILAQIFDSSGSKVGSEIRVNELMSGRQLYSEVTPLSDGFVVTWQEANGANIFGRVFDASGNPISSEFQVDSTAGDQSYPSVTNLKDGGFVIAYNSWLSDSDGWGVVGQRYDASGNTIGSEFQINSYTSSYQWNGGAATWIDFLANGGFVATWMGPAVGGNNDEILAQVFDASGNKVGSEIWVNTTIDQRQMHPSVRSLSDGSFIVTWQSYVQDGSEWGTYGQRFDVSGTKLGSEFQVNTNTSSNQSLPVIAPLAEGGFTIAWQSDSQDGSEEGVYAQRFASPTPSGTVTTTDHTVSTVTGSTTGEAPFGSDVSFGVGGKTLTVDLSAHHDGSNNDYYGAAEAIATAINGDSDLQTLGYSAAAATLAEVNAGTYAAGDIIITRADTPTTTTNTLVGNAASFVVEGITVNTDLSAYNADLSGAAAAVASDINADAALQALDYSATADTSNPGDIIITRANTPITQAYVAAAPATTAMSLASGGSARAAVAKIDTAITTVNIQRSELGAVSNRLNHTVNNLTNISANLSAARGGIEDADFALDTTQLAKLQILNQAATAMLAQANASKQNILSLLQQ
ncbi:flagellin [Paracoccaceae bacterium]|nr:flagellin [Paracoccaceae bacterium]